MKSNQRLMIVAALAATLCGCGMSATKPPQKQPVVDIHNAQNSLDYEGTYVGNLATASGAGMVVFIMLEKDTYLKKVEYVGKKGVFENSGKYTWNEAGTTVTLDGITDSPNKYFVAENRLIQLDMEGKEIAGALAEQYMLQKKLK